jgi:hypothetical protein
MYKQGTARQGGAAFIWKWGAICGVVLGMIQIIISLLPFGSLKTILDYLVLLLGRTLVEGDSDLATAYGLAKQIQVTPLSRRHPGH